MGAWHTKALGPLLMGLAFAAHAAGDGKFELTSSDLKPGATIGKDFVYGGCGGKNFSPALSWSGAPAGTKSFAVTAYDPDAPTGSGWWHWQVINLSADTHALERGAGDAKDPKLPAGAQQSRTDFGESGYGGPCPPPGKPHHYIFTVYALKTDKIDVPADASGAMVGYHIRAEALAHASLTGLYATVPAK